MIIPEVILLNTLKNLLKLIRADYAANSGNVSNSLLYKILTSNAIERYDFAKQAETVFIQSDPRKLDVNLFFNAKRAHIPTIHITLPSESEKNNALSLGEGFHEPIFYNNDEEYVKTFNRRYGTKYNLILSSDNTTEVVLMYHFIRNCLISLNVSMSLFGLENIRLSGGDLQINSSLVPDGIFMRAIGIEFEYDVQAQELTTTQTQIFDILGVTALPDVSVS